MKHVLKAMLAIALFLPGSPTTAHLVGVSGMPKKALEQKEKIDELTISETEERNIGENVSAKIRLRFGVVQDVAVHKYVALVGMTLAKASDRPNLAWTFIVLDTDGVNAFASPGGLVHITRGALSLIRNEAELAGVLAHEIGHVTRKHTVNAIRKSKEVQSGTKETLDQFANGAYEMVLENNFDRSDELDADRVSVELMQKSGYASGSLSDFLARLDDRNKDQPSKNGLFASHLETKERIAKIQHMAAKHGALVEARYKSNVKYEPTPITSIAAVPEDSRGLTGSTKSNNQTSSKEESSPDRAAKGGANPAIVKSNVTAGELATFKRAIA